MKLSFSPASPFFTAYDAGAGAGGPGAGLSSPESGAGAGSGSTDRGAGGGAGGAGSTPYKLTDDSMVDLGDGKATKWSEARGNRYVPKEDHDRYVKTFESAKPMLESYAKQLDEGYARLRQLEAKAQGGGPGAVQARKDLAEEIESLPVLDGAAGAKMIRDLRSQGLAPIAQMVASQQAQIKALTDQLNGIRGTTGVLSEQHQNQNFENHVTENLRELGEIKGIGTLDVNDPTVRDLAKDLWGAYDAKTWTIPEYRKMLHARIEGFVQLVTKAQRANVEKAKENKRKFFDTRSGGGNPSGERGYKHMSGLDLARESGLFDKSASA